MRALVSIAEAYGARCHPVSQLKKQVCGEGRVQVSCCRDLRGTGRPCPAGLQVRRAGFVACVHLGHMALAKPLCLSKVQQFGLWWGLCPRRSWYLMGG